MVIYERDIAVDMGTSNTLVFSQGKGLVLREPTVVAVDKVKDKMLKIGEEAKKTLGRTPANVIAIHPIRAGVISDYDMSALMLRERCCDRGRCAQSVSCRDRCCDGYRRRR